MNRIRKLMGGGVAVIALLGALALSGCATSAGNDVASLDDKDSKPATSESPKSSEGTEGDLLKFAACMRENGVNMPDPDPNNPSFNIPTTEKSTLDAAMKSCQKYLGTPPAGESAAAAEQFKKFAACMRENGLPNFPDPDADGTLNLPEGIDPDSQEFKQADKTCAEQLSGDSK